MSRSVVSVAVLYMCCVLSVWFPWGNQSMLLFSMNFKAGCTYPWCVHFFYCAPWIGDLCKFSIFLAFCYVLNGILKFQSWLMIRGLFLDRFSFFSSDGWGLLLKCVRLPLKVLLDFLTGSFFLYIFYSPPTCKTNSYFQVNWTTSSFKNKILSIN